MSRISVILIILLAVFSLGIIIAGQVFWVSQAYSIQEKQFNDRVVIALSSVVDRILVMNKDSALTEPVIQKGNNFFVANINDTPEPYLLETLLKEEFENSNLIEDFEYGIYDCFTDSIVSGGRVNFNNPGGGIALSEIKQKVNFQKKDGHYFGVLFPNKSTLILKQLDFWKYSSIVLLLIVIFFSYAIFLILRQKKLSEIKTDFINNMTHELKTPISTIALSSEVLSAPGIAGQPERFAQYVNIIRNETQRLMGQVEKVLQIATLSPRKVRLNREELDMHEILRIATETFSTHIENESGRIITRMNASNPCISGDRVHITNVVYNLLDNAVKYTENSPVVKIDTWNDEHSFYLRISDNGIGMEKNQLKLIFKKFYRVPTGDVHNVEGFGLGLFYVKTIMKAHKGHIVIESTPGKGTSFILSFKTPTHGK
ncbi:MAG: HAMP domain-containing histidine kinase [Crocinitomicaceae bacterium]|nr:HAMP domain-containing histidine kinase [Crocinitomicaceae bacterium]